MKPGRRELLAWLAGVPVTGLVGCGLIGGNPLDGCEGELLAPDFRSAHRFRDGWRPEPPAKPEKRHRVAIVGGGIAGLSAAWHLQRRGIDDFVVLELGQRAGGTSLSGDQSGFRFPWGAHYVPVPMAENVDLIDLFREMGDIESVDDGGRPIVRETILCREPEERVFSMGRWQYGLYPAEGADEEDLGQLKRFRDEMEGFAAARDASGRRLFAIPMSNGSSDEEVRRLDQQSMADWLRDHGFDSLRLHWLVDYSCRDDYGLTSEQASAWAGIFYFASRLRGDGSESQHVMTWPSGNGRIVDYLSEVCGDRLQSGHMVYGIQESGEEIQVDAWDTESEKPVSLNADHVIFAAPQFVAPRVIRGWAPAGRSINSFRYGGWVVANVFLKDRPSETGVGMCWDNVLVDSQSLGYVASTHQTGSDYGATVLTWYYPMLEDDPKISRAELLKLNWRDWATVVLSDLQKAHPDIAALVTRLDVMRWGHAMIQPRVGFVWGSERAAASASIGKIHFASTDLSGVALMEEAFDRGIRAAEKCLG